MCCTGKSLNQLFICPWQTFWFWLMFLSLNISKTITICLLLCASSEKNSKDLITVFFPALSFPLYVFLTLNVGLPKKMVCAAEKYSSPKHEAQKVEILRLQEDLSPTSKNTSYRPHIQPPLSLGYPESSPLSKVFNNGLCSLFIPHIHRSSYWPYG